MKPGESQIVVSQLAIKGSHQSYWKAACRGERTGIVKQSHEIKENTNSQRQLGANIQSLGARGRGTLIRCLASTILSSAGNKESLTWQFLRQHHEDLR